MADTISKSDPLAEVRAKLKSGTPAASSQANTPLKADPLAAVRNKLKSGVKAPSTASKQPLLADFQLDQLYQKGTQGKPPHIQHTAGLKAVYDAGLNGTTTV